VAGDLPLVPGHEIAEVGSEVTKHAVQAILLDVVAATRDAGALLSGDPVRLGRCCARSHTARDRRPGLRGRLASEGKGHGTPTNSWTTCSTTREARQRSGMTRAAPRLELQPIPRMSAVSTSVMDE
jgi:hypothetical protein